MSLKIRDSMKIPLLDLKAQYQSLKPEITRVLNDLFENQQFILGPQVELFEKAVANYCGVEYGCGVSSGTDALLIALMNEGIGAGDEVITTPYTFFATCGSIVRLGARPVFVDIDPITYNMNVDQVAARVNLKTRAIMPVHLYGQTTPMTSLLEIARKHKLAVIEDAAQAIGAEDEERRAGSMGRYGCLSFFPSKNLGGFGDGGMVVSHDAEVIRRLKMLRNHGSERKYYYETVGGNFRLDAIQAAVLMVKLKYLEEWTEKRIKNAQRYNDLFSSSGLVSKGALVLPQKNSSRHVYNQYIIRVQKRDELMRFLSENGVGTEVYYPQPLHLQECFRYLGYCESDFPESEKASRETLALPIYPELSTEQQDAVVAAIQKFFKTRN